MGLVGFALSFTKTNGTYGAGGNGYGVNAYWWNDGGGSGGFNTEYVDVLPGEVCSITVGAGGKYDSDYDEGSGTDGKSGFVLIAYGGDI